MLASVNRHCMPTLPGFLVLWVIYLAVRSVAVEERQTSIPFKVTLQVQYMKIEHGVHLQVLLDKH